MYVKSARPVPAPILLSCALVALSLRTVPVAAEGLRLDFYYSPGCHSCIEFLDKEVPKIEERLALSIDVVRYDLLDPDTFTDFQRRVEEVGVRIDDVPVIFIGPVVLQGNREITEELEPVLKAVRERMASGETVEEALAGVSVSMSVSGTPVWRRRVLALPVVAAGLLDGINPCAFTTLIFLLAALAVAGRSRREIFVLGLFYSASVFVTYFLVGLGFFQMIRAAHAFPVFARGIRWVLVAVLLVFAALSVYDWTRIRSGRPREILLQLPVSLKRRIHGSIRAYTRSAAVAGGAIVLGCLVSVFELACTGQIYFPTLTYLAREEADVRSYLLLGLYNVGFIAPLLVVFGISYAGVSSQRIARAFQTHLGAVKLGTAALFLALAALTVVM